MKPGRTAHFAAAIAASLVVSARAQDASSPEEIEITVGADGTATVREVRSAQLVAGESALRVFDVSPMVRAETVAVRALASPELVQVTQQNAWFEVLDPARALERLSGRPATIYRYHDALIEKLEGRLLFPPAAPGPDGMVRLPLFLEQRDGKIRVLDGAELEIEIDSLPQGDWNRFRLDWRVQCRRADRYRLELVYVTGGLRWQADYLLRVAADGGSADLAAVATIANETGIAWRNVRLAVAEAEGASTPLHAVADAATLDVRAAPQFSLAQASDAKLRVVPTLRIDRARAGEGQAVLRRLDLLDAAARGLTRALPAGTARVVVVDAKNRPLLAATRPFAATAAGETLSFLADPIPGVVADVETQPVAGEGAARVRVQVRFWNERDEKIDVEALCPLGIGERVADSSIPSDLVAPSLARFVVPLAPRGGATLAFNLARP